MPERPWTDEFTLLCERCGYVIEGLDPGGACPECGKAIAESLPERRVGTAWQRRASFISLLQTMFASARHPTRTLDDLQVRPHGHELAFFQILTATVISALIGVAALAIEESRLDLPKAPELLVGVAMYFMFAIIVASFCITGCMILTWIETRGLIFFGARRGLRVTPAIAWSITGHGCVGWVIGGFGGAVCLSLSGMAFGSFTNHVMGSLFFWLGVLCLLAGFLFFEVFAWLGLRRCRFANRVRPIETSPERE